MAILDYGAILVAWAVAATLVRRAWRGWMLAGIALSVVGAVVQQLGWDVSSYFNHNDLYHVIQAAGLYGFYRAAGNFGTAAHPAQSGK